MNAKCKLLSLLVLCGLTMSASAQKSNNTQLISKFFKTSKAAKATSKSLSKANSNLRNSTLMLLWTGTAWDTTSRDLFTYDANDRNESTISERFFNSAFIQFMRTQKQFDANGREIVNIRQMQDSAQQWVNNAKDSMAYDANGNVIYNLTQTWNNGAWENSNRTRSGFNSYNLDTLMVTESWNGSSWDIIHGSRTQVTYNTSGKMTEAIQQEYDSTGWVNTSKIVFTLDGSGNINGASIYSYDAANNSWTESARIVNASFHKNNFELPTAYTLKAEVPVLGWIDVQKFSAVYNSDDMLDSSLTQTFNPITSSWTNENKEVYKYNTQKQQVLYTSQGWNNNAWEIEYGNKDDYTYDSAGREIQHINSYWDNNDKTWKFTSKQIHSYPAISAIAENNAFSAHKIYPNPVREMVKVEVLGVKAERVKISITDIAGRQVYTNNLNTQAGILNATIYTSDLKSGIYIMQIQAGNQVVNQKIVKE